MSLAGAWLPKYLCSHGTQVSNGHGLAFHLGNMLSAGGEEWLFADFLLTKQSNR
jgi:hypothetical protein